MPTVSKSRAWLLRAGLSGLDHLNGHSLADTLSLTSLPPRFSASAARLDLKPPSQVHFLRF